MKYKLGSLLFGLLACAAVNVPASPAYPLKASSNGRYMVDQNNHPVLMIGDAPHSLLVNLTTNDALMYLQNRGSNGINTLWVELLANSYVGGPPDGHDMAGDTPFTGLLPSSSTPDFTTPNTKYFDYVDFILNCAATNGIQILLDSLDTGGWSDLAVANGSNSCWIYGNWLGNRYKNFTNITWITGNDFQYWEIAQYDTCVRAVAQGIQSVDTNHLQTTELNYTVSESLDDPNWWSILGLNGVYTYFVIYDETLAAYNKTNFIPVFVEEAAYEDEAYYGEGGSLSNLRRQEYWSLLSGALAGHMYGDHYTWGFISGWQTNLNTPGVTELGYFQNVFTNRAWYNLVPDTSHSVVTAGYGTYLSGDSLNEDSDYVTAARAPDGSLIVAYTPVNHTMTVDMTQLSNTATARWFDPTSGTYATIPGSPFANAGTQNFTPAANNAAGDPDWVLVLDAVATIPPQITAGSINGVDFILRFTTVSGQTYELQREDDLQSNEWLPVVTNIPGTGGIVQVADTNSLSQLARFYRLETSR